MKAMPNRVVLKVNNTGDQYSSGGIALPDTCKEENQGTIIAVGKNCEGLKEGDLVIFNVHGGAEVKNNGETFKVLEYKDVLIVL